MSDQHPNKHSKNAEVAALQAVARQLHGAPVPKRSRRARRAGLRKVQAAKPIRHSRLSWKFLSASVGFIIMLIIATILSSGALPGHTLYPLKRISEAAQDSASFTLDMKINNSATFINRRAYEIAAIANKGASPEKINALSQDLRYAIEEFDAYVSMSSDKQQMYAEREIQVITQAIEKLQKIEIINLRQESSEIITNTIQHLESISNSSTDF